MSDSPWIAFYPSDWLAGTRGLSAAETGIYITLIASMYERGEPIAEDHSRLARLCGSSTAAFKRCLSELIEAGKIVRFNGGLWNDRVGRESSARAERRGGSAGARARWGDSKEAGLKRSERLREARRKGTHTAEEWQAMLDIHGHACVKCGNADEKIVKDHITPVYQGGSDAIENLQPLCTKCNASKGPEAEDFRLSDWKKRLQNACKTPTSRARPTTTTTTTEEPSLRSGNARETVEREFDEQFWPAWPHKVGKPDARKKFITARRTDSLETILAGVRRYIASKPPDRPWLNPSTFLHQRRWEDSPAEVRPNGHGPPAVTGFAAVALETMTDHDGPDQPSPSDREPEWAGPTLDLEFGRRG